MHLFQLSGPGQHLATWQGSKSITRVLRSLTLFYLIKVRKKTKKKYYIEVSKGVNKCKKNRKETKNTEKWTQRFHTLGFWITLKVCAAMRQMMRPDKTPLVGEYHHVQTILCIYSTSTSYILIFVCIWISYLWSMIIIAYLSSIYMHIRISEQSVSCLSTSSCLAAASSMSSPRISWSCLETFQRFFRKTWKQLRKAPWISTLVQERKSLDLLYTLLTRNMVHGQNPAPVGMTDFD